MSEKAKPKVVVFIQARCGSTRMPGKVMRKILGKEVLRHVVDRVAMARLVDEIVVITSTSARDSEIADLCRAQGIACYRGSEHDLLDRHYRAAQAHHADFVVKIPSDQPLVDPVIIDRVIGMWLNAPARYDYVSNYHPPTFPDGLDVEGCPFPVLETAWRESTQPHEREHTFAFIWDNPDRFRIGNITNPRGNMFMTCRWTLDYEEDYRFARRVIEELKDKPDFGMDDVQALLERKPDIRRINERFLGVNWYRNVEGKLKTVPRYLYRKDKPLRVTESLKLLRRAKRVIPCATQTLSKGYLQWSVGASPLFLSSAKGCEVYDVDGNAFIDYAMALGPCILGYCDPDVNAAVREQLEKGTMFTLPHPLETAVAEKIIEHVPCAEMVRFGKNGSDATTAAVKLARAYTGREKIITCGYHGWHDWYIAGTERDAGVPRCLKELVFPMKYNDLKGLRAIIEAHKGEIAGLIMEPVAALPPHEGFLRGVRQITRQHGIVLIFDELFTGFRWGMGGAQGYFRVTPDLACFGKALANGFPLSAVAGKRRIMGKAEEVFFSFAYGGETLSLAAAVATMKKLEDDKIHAHIAKWGGYLRDGFAGLVRKHGLGRHLSISGYPFKSVVIFNGSAQCTALEMKTYFQQECAKRGILFIGYHLVSWAHKKEHIDFTLEAYDDVMRALAGVLKRGALRKSLEGSVLTQIFRDVGDRSSGPTR